MTTKLNIGLTQKAAEGGGGAAREASLHLELEVEPGLLAEPPRLHKRIRQLFHLLRTTLAEELNRPAAAQTAPRSTRRRPQCRCRRRPPASSRAGSGSPRRRR